MCWGVFKVIGFVTFHETDPRSRKLMNDLRCIVLFGLWPDVTTPPVNEALLWNTTNDSQKKKNSRVFDYGNYKNKKKNN